MTELSPALIDDVCSRISEHGFFPDACLVEAGVTMRRARMWLRKGEELEREAIIPEPRSQDELCLSLVAGVHHAEAVIENQWCLEWNAAIKGAVASKSQAAAAAWRDRLERRFPEKYKRPAGDKPQASVSFDELVKQRSATQTK